MELTLFIDGTCPSCERAVGIANEVAARVPSLSLSIVNLTTTTAEPPDFVIATPTYALDSRIVSLGNPRIDELETWVLEALAAKGLAP